MRWLRFAASSAGSARPKTTLVTRPDVSAQVKATAAVEGTVGEYVDRSVLKLISGGVRKHLDKRAGVGCVDRAVSVQIAQIGDAGANSGMRK